MCTHFSTHESWTRCIAWARDWRLSYKIVQNTPITRDPTVSKRLSAIRHEVDITHKMTIVVCKVQVAKILWWAFLRWPCVSSTAWLSDGCSSPLVRRALRGQNTDRPRGYTAFYSHILCPLFHLLTKFNKIMCIINITKDVLFFEMAVCSLIK